MNIILSKFFSLKPEKQERILNAAIKEFAQKGFENASTNEIVKEAGISKGLLFHYFNSKKELFLFLFDYSLEIIKTELLGLINPDEKDVLARYCQIALLKRELIPKHPWIFDFIKVVAETQSEQVKGELENRKKDLRTIGYAKLFENIDESKFKPGVDVKRAIRVIIWAIEGFEKEAQEEEFYAYIEVRKNCFYK